MPIKTNEPVKQLPFDAESFVLQVGILRIIVRESHKISPLVINKKKWRFRVCTFQHAVEDSLQSPTLCENEDIQFFCNVN